MYMPSLLDYTPFLVDGVVCNRNNRVEIQN
jgi:hypothetical protein